MIRIFSGGSKVSRYEVLRRVAKGCSLILLIVMAAECKFDAERQFNLRFPATLTIKNETKETVVVNSILSLPEAENTVLLKGGPIAPTESLSYRIAESDYRVILAGAFVLRGSCGGNQDWEIPGAKLARQDVHDAKRWEVTVLISTCEP